MFNKPHVQHTRVQQNYVEQTLCSTNPMFNKTLCLTPVGLVTRTLYVLHRSRAFHEVWCPKDIGRDSWVREAMGVSVQKCPPQKL